ncbi:hypothetical protein AcW2_007338 [Taiwanofungus camphoratus]|nr:hypothetical protein AcW2_007338 [Antrodia cinnamomea]
MSSLASLSAIPFYAWRKVQRAVLEPAARICKDPLCSVAEAAIVSLLKSITLGRLVVHTSSRTYVFPAKTSQHLVPRESDLDGQMLNAELTVRSPIFWLRLASMGDLGFAEAYMYGEVECADLFEIFEVFLANSACLASLDTPLARLSRIPQQFAGAYLINTLANARRNISAHYDISNEMFMGFLSKDMTYSCAIFPGLDADLRSTSLPSMGGIGVGSPGLTGSPAQRRPSIGNSFEWTTTTGSLSHSQSTLANIHLVGLGLKDTQLDAADGSAHPSEGRMKAMQNEDALYEAQMRKLRHIVRKADIRQGHRVLEIGTGWGALGILIATTVPGTTVDTLTLSTQQAALAGERVKAAGLEARVRVHLMDYRDMPKEWEGAFDRLVSVEMVEAVGREFLETYWEKIDWALKRETGVGVIQGITLPEARFETYVCGTDFIRKSELSLCLQIFPGGFLPTLTLLVDTLTRASQGRLVVDSVSNIGPHYARTLREWRLRFEACFEDVVVPALKKQYSGVADDATVGREEIDVFRRKWLYYFCYCEMGFAIRALGDHIIAFTREGNVDYGCQVFE